jgi:amidohydrolase
MKDALQNWISKNEGKMKATFHHLHSNPEISWEEKQTTIFLCQKLTDLEIPYITFEDQTGVIGFWGDPEEGPTIAIRADMDALWQNVNGEWKANHSCGHDAHMTMVLHTVEALKESGFQPKGLIKIIFQPAEESGLGAKSIIQKGVIDDVDYMLGIHLRPIQELSLQSATPAIYHGSTTLLKGKIHGLQAHGARPNLGINVIDSLAAIINAVNSVKIDPTIPHSAKVTVVSAGDKNVNIIPDYAEFGVDIRAQTNEAMNDLLEKVKLALVQAGQSNGATVDLAIIAQMMAAIPHPFMEQIVQEAIEETLGIEGAVIPHATPGGEDFHFYTTSFPKLKATMVGLGCNLAPGLHHPNMSFDLSVLTDGVKILSLSIVKLFDRG